MVVYFHTATAILAVANGICSQVMDRDGFVIEDHPLHLHRLLGGVADALTATEIKVDEGSIVPGLRLQFDFRGATLTTDPVISIERAPSLSIRPQPRSIPPGSRDSSEEAKLSERILEFAQSLVEMMVGDPPQLEEVNFVATVASVCWNLPVIERINRQGAVGESNDRPRRRPSVEVVERDGQIRIVAASPRAE